MTDEQSQLDLVVAALDAAGAVPHTIDELQRMKSRPAAYTEVTLSRRFSGEARVAGGIGTTGWRILTRAVGRTESNAREMRRLYTAALENVPLGTDGTPVDFETEDTIGGDDGWFSGMTTWTYAT